MQKHVLIVSNSEDAHARVIQKRLQEREVRVSRLDSDVFAKTEKQTLHIPASALENTSTWTASAVTIVWYRKVIFPDGEDSTNSFVRQELSGLFDAILTEYEHCRWVNPRTAIARAHAKVAQLPVAKRIGLKVPDTIITNDLDALTVFAERHNKDIVAKPMRAQIVGTGNGTRVIGTRKLSREHYGAAVAYAPCFAQERLLLRAEIRVVVFGTNVYAFRMTTSTRADDIKQVPLRDIHHSPCQLSATVERQLLELTRLYQLEFAAIDLAETDSGELVFLEVNPNGQWLWLQFATGVNLADPFIDFLCA